MESVRLFPRKVSLDKLFLLFFGQLPVIVDVVDDLHRDLDGRIVFIPSGEVLFFVELGSLGAFLGLDLCLFFFVFIAVVVGSRLVLLADELLIGVDLLLVLLLEPGEGLL